jgi:probable phosphoglycerate mutase
LQEAVQASGQSFFEYKPQGGERLVDVFERARKLMENLGNEKRKETVLVVSHGDFLRMVLGVIQEISLEEANRIHLDNTSYSIAELDLMGKWKIITINNTDHLSAE